MPDSKLGAGTITANKTANKAVEHGVERAFWAKGMKTESPL